MNRLIRPLPVLVLLFSSLAGCAPEQDDLPAWMGREASTMRGRVDPLPQVKDFPAYHYEQAGKASPFAQSRVEPERVQSASSLAPDINRPKEPLEAFNLETLKYVGILRKDGFQHALINTGTTIYQIRVGNHMGQDYGLVTEIDESQITLKELVEDMNGEWVERMTTLQLQEGTK